MTLRKAVTLALTLAFGTLLGWTLSADARKPRKPPIRQEITELKARIDSWWTHYEQVRGRPYAVPRIEFEYLGHAPKEFLRTLSVSAEMALNPEKLRPARAKEVPREGAPAPGRRGGLRRLVGRWVGGRLRGRTS